MKVSAKTVNMTKIKYTSLPGGIKAWQDPYRYKPQPFDLVEIDTGKKQVRGWWTGNRWLGLRLQERDKVVAWKKTSEQDFI